MRISCCFLAAGVILAAASLVNAGVTDWTCQDDGDHAIVMGAHNGWSNPDGSYTMQMSATQYGSPGHISGTITSDSDPTVYMIEGIQNQTDYAWTDYHIEIGMTTSSFTIDSTVTPTDWTPVITAPVYGPLPGNIPGPEGWVGYVDFYAAPNGSPIPVGQSGTFGVVFSFTSPGTVNFATAQTPTPEPCTLALLSLGALAVIRRKRA